MNIKKIIPAVLFLLPVALHAQQGYTINGKVGDLNSPAKVYLRYANKIDSAELKNGRFLFTGKASEPVFAALSVKHQKSDTSLLMLRDVLVFYLENAKMNIVANDSVKHATIKGSPLNDDNQNLNELLKTTKEGITKLRTEWTGIKRDESNGEAYDKAADSLRKFMADYKQINNEFIAAHPNSYVSLMAFTNNSLGYNFDIAEAEKQFNKFSAALRNTEAGKKAAEKISIASRSQIGVMAADFQQKDLQDKPVKLSDFKGKYVLVDFWASWCKPCRMENPNLVEAYKNYKDKNFTIFSVSLDDEKAKQAWINAIAKDNMTWPQASDLQGWKNSAAILYGIDAIPSNFLVDPSGKIIARNLRGDELNKKLSEIL